MSIRSAAALAVIALAGSSSLLAAEVGVEYSHTDDYAGFGAIDHVAVGLTLPLSDKFKSTLKLERREQEAVPGNPGAKGNFVEGIFNYDLGPSFYGMTRIGATDENTLFVDDSLYQEFGWKAGQFGPAFIDLNAGIGTRKFTTGRETFVSVGPTFSWSNGALWLRREQSTTGGGYRHLATVRQEFLPGWHVEAFALDEKRRKYTLPIGPGVTGTDFEGQRYSLGIGHQLTQSLSLYARAEKVSLERVGTPGKYYAPSGYSLGLNYKF
jgi:hypothetical protein